MSNSIGPIERLRTYLAADPENTLLACDLLDAHFSAGDYAGADAVVAALPEITRHAAGVRFRAARSALVQGRHADAERMLLTLAADGHDNIALAHDIAFCQLCQRNTNQATATIADAVARFGDSVELAIVDARVATMAGDFGRAHAALDRALALDPDDATARGLRALILLDEGRVDDATSAALQCLETYPDQHEALLVAGTTALWKQQVDDAQRHFDRALARHPNSGRALSGMGQVHMLRSDLASAQTVLAQAVIAMPDHIGTWHALAWAQLLQGEVDAAEASYQRAYALDHNFAESHGGLALVHALKGRTADAEPAIKRALRLDPRCVTALYAKSLLLDDAGRHDEADAVFAGLMSAEAIQGMDIREFARSLRARLSQRVG